jgi:Fur family zinc uptake transcriptional regulator
MGQSDDKAAADAFREHDHSICAARIMSRAEARCRDTGLRLTPVRRRALEILLESHRALGAYDLLERLAEDGFGAQPPVAYRALDFLVEAGLAHRVRRLNAYAACMHPGERHDPVFLICETCRSVAETPAAPARAAVGEAAADIGFEVQRVNMEGLGLCPACRSEATA